METEMLTENETNLHFHRPQRGMSSRKSTFVCFFLLWSVFVGECHETQRPIIWSMNTNLEVKASKWTNIFFIQMICRILCYCCIQPHIESIISILNNNRKIWIEKQKMCQVCVSRISLFRTLCSVPFSVPCVRARAPQRNENNVESLDFFTTHTGQEKEIVRKQMKNSSALHGKTKSESKR